ncbi:uncharacterized protein LOC124113574 [Haliotis rufescens]|uniref:uncharacterized protein LOC124113574 n=1 Tax=Haliotis rufescens TaxID=6454 RepID=UPI00201EE9F8|nr:uncharacterized protein LOC124113574 [Haliotis rufescens]
MSLHVLASLVFCLSVSRLKYTHGESIAFGKLAKQSSTYIANRRYYYLAYPASQAINPVYWMTGSYTNYGNPSWWEVDLRGYYSISNITLTAAYNGWHTYMANAYVEVMDKDISLCSDVKVEWCGNVSSTVASGEKFNFTCNATFPIRFVRVTRRTTGNNYLGIGQVDVQGVGATKRYRSYYTPTTNRKVSIPSLTTSAVTAGQCGILCHQNHSCIDFSYSKTASTDANCLLSNKEVPQNSVANNAWTMYTLNNCL